MITSANNTQVKKYHTVKPEGQGPQGTGVVCG